MKRFVIATLAAALLALGAPGASFGEPSTDPAKPGLGPPTGLADHGSCAGFGGRVSVEAQAPGPRGEQVSTDAQGFGGRLQHAAFCDPRVD